MELNDFLQHRRKLRNIKRFNMEYTIQQQNLAEHGFMVASLFVLICKKLRVDFLEKDLFLIMNHDFLETLTGDINLQVKEYSPITKRAWNIIEKQIINKELMKYSDVVIKNNFDKIKYKLFLFSDALDAFLYTKDEIELGNSALKNANIYYKNKLFQLDSELFKDILKILNIKEINFRDRKPIQYKINEHGCWICTSHSNKYRPKLKVNGKLILMSRYFLEQKLDRPLKEGYQVLHINSCNNGLCINPDHLYEGTSYQNVLDSIKLGTHKDKINLKIQQKLNDKQILEIRSSILSNQELSKKYKVSKSYLRAIKSNRVRNLKEN